MANLDRIAAQHAQRIIENTKQFTDEGQQKPISKDEVENVLTKALGVCQEQGVYAGLLYVLSRSNKTEKAIAQDRRGKRGRRGRRSAGRHRMR